MSYQTPSEIVESWKNEFIKLRRKQYDSGYQDAVNGICARYTTRTYLEGYETGLKTTQLKPQLTEHCLDDCVADEHFQGDDDFPGNG